MHTLPCVTHARHAEVRTRRTKTDVKSEKTSKNRQSEALGGSDECQSPREPVHLHRGSRLRRTHDDAHQTLMVRGPPGFPPGCSTLSHEANWQKKKKKMTNGSSESK